MKTISKLVGITLFMGLLFNSLLIYSQFSLSGEFRPRAEYRHGFKNLADSAQEVAFFTSQRTRLNLGYKGDKLNTFLTIQDIRTWGSTSQLNTVDGFLSIHEAWAEVFFTEKLALKAGRQELVYDDHRIFGSVAWVQQARSHDVALLKYTGPVTAHLGVGYNQDKEQLTTNVYTVSGNYKAIQFLWLNKKTDNLNISGLFLNNGLQYSNVIDSSSTEYSIKYSQTMGSYLDYKKDAIGITAFGYYQMGKSNTNTDISAYDISLEANYTIAKKLTLGAGFERLSGTSQLDTANTTNNSFTPFYGTNHKFNGFMDYYYVGNHSGTVGLDDIYFKLAYKHKSFIAKTDIHLFSAASEILDTEELTSSGEYKALNSSLGTEIDLTLIYPISPLVKVVGGYSHMIGSESLAALRGGKTDETSNWGYLMLIVTPKFLE